MSDLLTLIPATGVTRLVFDAAWQSTLIGGLVWLLLRFLVQKPAVRSWLAVLACVLCLMAPGISAAARMFGLGLLSNERAIAETQTPNTRSSETEPLNHPNAVVPDAVEAQFASIDQIDVPFVAATRIEDVVAAQPATRLAESPSPAMQSASVPQSVGFSVPSMWSVFCVGWSILAFVFLFRLGKSAIVLWKICRDADECEDPLLLKSSETAASLLKLSHIPRVYVSGQTTCPAVISWIHARLIVPPINEARSGDHWVSVFAHELAHVQRRDTWARLITELGVIVMPWQPLLWLLRREYQQASEEACDDWAVYAGADPFDYASCLTEWIPRQQPSLALGIAGWPQMVRRRIERLLEDRSLSRPALTVTGMTGTTIVAAAFLLLVALTQHGQLFSATWTPAASLVAAPLPSKAREVVGGKADRTEVPPATQKEAAAKSETPEPYPVVKVFGDGSLTHWNLAKVLGFGLDRKTVISIGLDRRMMFWNMMTGEPVKSLTLPPATRGLWKQWPDDVKQHHAACEVMIHDGTALVMCMANGEIRVVDVATRTHRILEHRVELPQRIVVSGDDTTLAVLRLTSVEQNDIDLIDLKSGRLIRTISRQFDHADDQTRPDTWRGLTLNRDGSKLATGRIRQVTVWDRKTGNEIWNVRASQDAPTTGKAGVLCFSPDDKMLASGGSVRDAETGDVLFEIRQPPRMEVAATRSNSSVVAFDPTNSKLAMISGDSVRVVELSTNRVVWVANVIEAKTTPSLQFQDDGSVVAVSSGHNVVLLDGTTGKRLHSRSHHDRITSIAVSQTKPELLLGYQSGRVDFVDLLSMEVADSENSHELPVEALLFSPDGESSVSSSGNRIVLHEAGSSGSRHVIDSVLLGEPKTGTITTPHRVVAAGESRSEDDPVTAASRIRAARARQKRTARPTPVAFSADSTRLFSFPDRYGPLGRSRKSLRCVSVENGQALSALQLPDTVLWFYGLTATADGQLVVLSPEHRGVLSFWNAESGDHVEDLARKFPRLGGRMEVAANREGNLIAFGIRADSIRLHNRRAKTNVDLQKGHRAGPLTAIAFDPTGKLLASAGENGRVVLWNTATGEQLKVVKAGPRGGVITDVAWDHSGQSIVTLNGDGTVSVRQVGASDILATSRFQPHSTPQPSI